MTFWDTSAVLALIFQEPHSPAALTAAADLSQSYAWRWTSVEAYAGLARRGAREREWKKLGSIFEHIHFVDIPVERYAELNGLNRTWRLRSADAGHLYCCQLVTHAFPDLEFVCFDEELIRAAPTAGVRLWEPGGAETAMLIHEAPAGYAVPEKRKRKRG